MKLIRVTFLLCAMAFLLLTPTSSLQLHSRYSSPSQAGVSDKIVIKMAPRKLMIISSEHVKVMTSGAHEGSSKQVRVTSSPAGKSKNEEKRLGEDEEEKALSKYLSMDYPKFRRRRPVHNKSLPLSESRP